MYNVHIETHQKRLAEIRPLLCLSRSLNELNKRNHNIISKFNIFCDRPIDTRAPGYMHACRAEARQISKSSIVTLMLPLHHIYLQLHTGANHPLTFDRGNSMRLIKDGDNEMTLQEIKGLEKQERRCDALRLYLNTPIESESTDIHDGNDYLLLSYKYTIYAI